MFASSILVMVILALLSAHMIGLRENQLVQSKSGASDSSRKVITQLSADIRAAKMWAIGNLGSSFVPDTSGPVQGNALQLNSTTNGSVFTIYYFDLSDTNNSNGRLVRSNNTDRSSIVLASNLIDTLYFTAEDYRGVTQNYGAQSYKNVIHTTLQYCQFQYPQTAVGTNGLYDYYRMDFRITPHLPE